jgi:hypothetical protein
MSAVHPLLLGSFTLAPSATSFFIKSVQIRRTLEQKNEHVCVCVWFAKTSEKNADVPVKAWEGAPKVLTLNTHQHLR